MRAISSFSFEAGISTRECLAAIALRIRVNISAMGSVMYISKSGVGCRVSGDGLGPAFKPAPDTWPLAPCFFYQLAFTTPGICPWSARSRKQIRHRLNLRRYARGRPQRLQRV